MPDSIGPNLPPEGASIRLASELLAGWAADTGDGCIPEPTTSAAVPPEYRRLLDQRRGMTSILTEHWGGEIRLRVRRQTLSPDGASLARDIVLLAGPGRDPVELAGIRVRLDAFPPAFCDRLRLGQEPFGRLLDASGIAFHVEVLGFLRLAAHGDWAFEAKVPAGTPLFGRVGRLWHADTGQCLAETAEMLPRTRLSPGA